MKSWLIQTAGKLGGYQLARWLTANQPKILMYHRFSDDVSPEAVSKAGFERQLHLIKRWFVPMTLTQLAGYVHNRKRVPKNVVVITVDDGYRDFYDVAYPLLSHYRIPATFFVTTGFINGDLWLWPDQVRWLLDRRPSGLGLQTLESLVVDMDRSSPEVWQAIVNHFLRVPDRKRIAGLRNLSEKVGHPIPNHPPENCVSCSWEQLAEMERAGIEIGGHTYSHPTLGRMDVEAVQHELSMTWGMLNDNLGAKPRSFCYPNGSPADYSPEIKEQVIRMGFTAAVTAFSDQHNISLPFAWRRFVGTEEDFQFSKSLYGVEHLGNRFRRTERCTY